MANFELNLTHLSKGNKISFPGYPNLNVTFVSYQDNRCPENVKCFWEGDVRVNLLVNGVEVQLNDHDQRKHQRSVVEVGGTRYILTGLGTVGNLDFTLSISKETSRFSGVR